MGSYTCKGSCDTIPHENIRCPKNGRKRCRTCEKAFVTDIVRCECCNNILSTMVRRKNGRDKVNPPRM